MPILALELPDCLSRLFPEEPLRIGPLVLLRQSLAAQWRADAALIERLADQLAAATGRAPDVEALRRAGGL